MDDDHNVPPAIDKIHQKMISSFITKIASSSRQLARLFLEAHQWEIDAAVSAFNEVVVASSARRNVTNPRDDSRALSSNPLRVYIPAASSPPSPTIRLRSPRSPPSRARNPFSREAIQQADDDFDDKEHEVAKESDDDVERAPLPSSLRGQTFRSVSDILSVTPEVIPRTVTVWRNGYVLDYENTLSTFDNPGNSFFLEAIESLESPRVLDSPDGKQRFLIKLIRRQEEDFPDPQQVSPKPFQGVGRTLAEQDSVPPASSDSVTTEPTPSTDPTAPTTSIQIVLADGRRINSPFNTHQTIRDVRDFIDAATPGDASRDYHLLVMGTFPPAPLTDLDQTIEQAGISDSVLTLKF